jgi:hypothetical protein
LSLALVGSNPGEFLFRVEGAADAETWAIVRALIAEVAGVVAEDITPSTRFVEDLGF